MEQKENQLQQSNPPIQKEKNTKILHILVSVILTAVLVSGGVFFWKQNNYKKQTLALLDQLEQVKKDNATLRNKLQNLEKPVSETAVEKEDAIIDTTNWQSTDIIGLLIRHPLDSSVREPQLTADIDIVWDGNKRENQELVDGWIIGITYSDDSVESRSSQDKAIAAKASEDDNNCTTSSIDTITIGDTEAYYFYTTGCPGYDSSLYYVTSDTYHYVIRASYEGKDKQVYKALTEEIISNIAFKANIEI